METDIMQPIQVLRDGPRECEDERIKRSSYLEKPVAPAVEGGDDGRVDIAAVQTLQTK